MLSPLHHTRATFRSLFHHMLDQDHNTFSTLTNGKDHRPPSDLLMATIRTVVAFTDLLNRG